jgi:hypothetical protein
MSLGRFVKGAISFRRRKEILSGIAPRNFIKLNPSMLLWHGSYRVRTSPDNGYESHTT